MLCNGCGPLSIFDGLLAVADAICAGAVLQVLDAIIELAAALGTFGKVLGVARLARVISWGELDPMNASPWRVSEVRFGLVFEAPRKLQRPWRAKGGLGIWSLREQLIDLERP